MACTEGAFLPLLGTARLHVFKISGDETRFSRRGFHAGYYGIRERLERIGSVFLQGYHIALRNSRWSESVRELEDIPLDFRGFAYEGASMAIALTCAMVPGRWPRFAEWCNGPAERHLYMAYVGGGWAAARVPWLRSHIEERAHKLDTLLGALVINGYGFHQGYFNRSTRGMTAQGRRVFDEGFGRSLWFRECGDVERITGAIGTLAVSRRPDLWSGVGLAATYAGRASETDLIKLRSAAGSFVKNVTQGCAFAAKARQRAGNITEYTESACGILCHSTAAEAAAVTDRAMEMERARAVPDYLRWRETVANELEGERRSYGHVAPAYR